MKPLKIMSSADWHFHKEYFEPFMKSFNTFYARAKEENPDLISIAGDLMDRAVQNTSSAQFDTFVSCIKKLLGIAPVVTVYGTPSHDIPGSLQVLQEIKGSFPFVIIKACTPYLLVEGNKIVEVPLNLPVDIDFAHTKEKLLILGIPEVSDQYIKKDDSSVQTEAVNSMVSNLMTSYMVLRQKYLHIPCLVVYHGGVAGAKPSENQFQLKDGIQAGWRDIASIGADYVSCGHYHLAQEIGKGINAFYEGSIFPVSWGELTRKQFSIVTITDDVKGQIDQRIGGLFEQNNSRFAVSREVVYFPHPVRQKEKLDLIRTKTAVDPEGKYLDRILQKHDVKGKEFWIEITVSETDAKLIDTEACKKILLSAGALPASRVSTKVVRIETLRASSITEKKTIYGKVQVWADNSGVKLSSTIEKRCAELEEQFRKQGFSHDPRHFVLLEVDVKGAKGLWKGMRKKHVHINFTQFGAGTLAFMGDNGRGKSTIIKQCNPFAEPMSGKGTVADDFFLKDSLSQTIWQDVVSGKKYKAVKDIDGRPGKNSKYYLYVDEGQGWRPYNSEQTGRLAPYKEAIQEVFGSAELFKRSAYIAQKNNELPDTPKARKELFNELIGNDYLETMAGIAAENVKALDKDTISLTSRIDVRGEQLKHLPVLLSNLQTSIEKRKGMDKEFKELEARGFQLKAELEILKQQNEENERINREIESLTKALEMLNSDIASITNEIANLQRSKSGLEESRKKFTDNETLKKQKQALQDQLQQLSSERTALNDKYNTFTAEKQEELKPLRDQQSALDREVSQIQGKIKNSNLYIQQLQDQKTANELPCENCNHISGSHQRLIDKAVSEIEITEKTIEQMQKSLSTKTQQQAEFVNQIAGIQTEIDAREKSHTQALKEVNEKITAVNQQYMQIKVLNEYDVDQLQKAIKSGETAEIEIKSKSAILEQKRAEIEQKQVELNENEDKYDIFLKDQVKSKEDEYETAREDYSEKKTELATLTERIKAQENEKEQLQAAQLEQEADQTKLAELKPVIDDWKILERALGRNGVQALELDAAAPSIAAKANALLERTFGSRYEIDFDTLREKNDGSTAETFEVAIIDHEEQVEALRRQSISTLSGGEERWFLKALFDAFGIIREENTGLKYLTAFQDEADGALSPEKKYLYLKMMEAAHAESGRHHTVYITHDATIQQVIPQKIQIEDLPDVYVEEEKKGEAA